MKFDVAFDDVLIEPTYSTIRSRNDVDTSNILGFSKLAIPMISSPMDTVTESTMAIEIGRFGGMGILHRFASTEQRIKMLREVIANKSKNPKQIVALAIGVSEEERNFLEIILDQYHDAIDLLCIDIANGHSIVMAEMIEFVKNKCNIPLMVGNVATGTGYKFLAEMEVDSIRVGLGGGCLEPSMPIDTIDGSKPISDIKIGDYVMTHLSEYKEVIDLIPSFKNEELIIINGLETTADHEYYVIRRQDVGLINDNNIHQYAIWLEAQELSKDFLLVEVDLKRE